MSPRADDLTRDDVRIQNEKEKGEARRCNLTNMLANVLERKHDVAYR